MVPSSRWSPSFRVLMLATLIVLISISHLIPPASGARSQPKSSPVSKNEQQQQQRLSGHQQVKEFFAKGVKGVRGSTSSSHTNNWAVLVCASRYWFNYRHMANALGLYRTVKRLGIPDSNIILMLADDVSCNSRNKYPASVYAERNHHLDLYGENIEVDYRGYEVTVENVIRVLTGRMDKSVPRNKRLLTDEHSNVFVYMTGHGGNEFLKFQDTEEISAFDIADAFEQMHQKKRYNEILFMIDTCQANTMYTKIYSPNILATGSSVLGESSYSYEHDHDVGVSLIDAYTHFVLQFMEGINKTSHTTVKDLFDSYDPVPIKSHPGVRSDLFKRPLDQVQITDFFGGVSQAEVLVPANPRVATPAAKGDNYEDEEDETEVEEQPVPVPPSSSSSSAAQRPNPKQERGLWKLLLRLNDGDSEAQAARKRSWSALGVLGALVVLVWQVQGRRSKHGAGVSARRRGAAAAAVTGGSARRASSSASTSASANGCQDLGKGAVVLNGGVSVKT